MGDVDGNERLAGLLMEAGLSHKALARAVREASSRRGRPVGCDHTSVSRWLRGMRPRGETPELIAEVVAARLGRPVSAADVGFAPTFGIEPDLGVAYADHVHDAANALTRLWRADLDGDRALQGALSGDAATSAALGWMVRSGADVIEERLSSAAWASGSRTSRLSAQPSRCSPTSTTTTAAATPDAH